VRDGRRLVVLSGDVVSDPVRIRLGNRVFEGRNNAYLLGADTGEATLIDTAIATPEVRTELEAGLAEHGLGFADVEQVVLTHWHEDHVGLAGAIQAAGGATVRAHAADAPVIEQDPDAVAAMRERQHELFDEWGMPEAAREELLAFLDRFEDITDDPPSIEPFEDGAHLPVGDGELEAVHLPGHAAGLTGFTRAREDRPELFSGDALLPRYTPNVGGADVRVERALGKYLDTLVCIADGEFARAWPGHRDPIDDPTERAVEILTHHRERTERVVGVLAEHGPADAWTVSAHLFGDLEGIHILHGPGEADAHLVHLEAGGIVEHTEAGYRLVEPDSDLDELFPAAAVAASRPGGDD
jgi:hydroxyacylglutathione hydrolase